MLRFYFIESGQRFKAEIINIRGHNDDGTQIVVSTTAPTPLTKSVTTGIISKNGVRR